MNLDELLASMPLPEMTGELSSLEDDVWGKVRRRQRVLRRAGLIGQIVTLLHVAAGSFLLAHVRSTDAHLERMVRQELSQEFSLANLQ